MKNVHFILDFGKSSPANFRTLVENDVHGENGRVLEILRVRLLLGLRPRIRQADLQMNGAVRGQVVHAANNVERLHSVPHRHAFQVRAVVVQIQDGLQQIGERVAISTDVLP